MPVAGGGNHNGLVLRECGQLLIFFTTKNSPKPQKVTISYVLEVGRVSEELMVLVVEGGSSRGETARTCRERMRSRISPTEG